MIIIITITFGRVVVDGCTNGTGGLDGGALLIVGGVVLRCVALMMGFAVTTRDLLRRALTARARAGAGRDAIFV